jgi:hypothetical protein
MSGWVSAQQKDEFPASWQGTWSGDLNIYKGQKIQQTVPMTVEIKRIDSVRYVFALIYGPDKEKGRRPYELVIKNVEKGEYVFDEKNSIQMEAYLFDNKLFCWFTVQGTQLLSTYEKRGDSIVSEIVAGKNQPVSTTGGQTVNGEEIPPVQSFPLGSLQRAVLKKTARLPDGQASPKK